MKRTDRHVPCARDAAGRSWRSNGPTGLARAQFRSGGRRSWSNRGRWGTDDQIGALNLITPAEAAAGAALVQRGILCFALAGRRHPEERSTIPIRSSTA
jgi:hypothetical protein